MSGINLSHLKHDVVQPVLMSLGLLTDAALNLVTGTALAESDAADLKQIGGGPALGLWQMEPFTEQDIWNTFLCYKPALGEAVRRFLPQNQPTTQQLVWNLAYGAAMCRIKYFRSPMRLPAPDDAAGMADMHKQVYNSALGAANPTANIPKFQKTIDA